MEQADGSHLYRPPEVVSTAYFLSVHCTHSVTLGYARVRPPAQPIWTRPEPGARKPRFSREQIAAAALAIADTEGFEAVSIRRVAAELGAGTMSLYRYISAKSNLVALMDDAIMGESLIPGGQLPADWREALSPIARGDERHCCATRGPCRRCRTRAAPGRPVRPHGLRRFDESLAAVARPLDTAASLTCSPSSSTTSSATHARRRAASQARQRRPRSRRRYHRIHPGPDQRRPVPAPEQAGARSGRPVIADPGTLDHRFGRGLSALLDGAPPTDERPAQLHARASSTASHHLAEWL